MTEPPEARLRVFFALWPPAAVAEGLHRVAAALRAQAGGRSMARATLHQTLAFLGDQPAARIAVLEEVAAGFAGSAAGTLTLDRLGYWPHNRILWAAPSETPLALDNLVDGLNGALRAADFQVEKRRFQPHITLLRNVRQAPRLPVLEPLAWPLEEFVLVVSTLTPEGPRYRVLGRWALLA